MPEKLDTTYDTPRVVVDVPALIRKDAAWWSSQVNFKKMDLERFKKSNLLQGKFYKFLNKILQFLFFRISRLDIRPFLFLFLELLKLPDISYAGLPRGAVIWALLVKLLEHPFPVMGLVSSKLRGKSEIMVFDIVF